MKSVIMTGVWLNSFIRLMWKVLLCHCHNKATVYFNPFIMTKLRDKMCYMEHWKAILTKDRFLGIVCYFFFKFKSSWADPFNIIEHLCYSVFVMLTNLLSFSFAMFMWCHCTGCRKRLAGKFIYLAWISPTAKK